MTAADNEELDALLRKLDLRHEVDITGTPTPRGIMENDAAAAIRALRARVAELQAEIESAREHVGAIDEENFRLTRQLQQVKADAERLDWVDAQWVHNLHIEVRAKSTRPECYEPEATVFTRSDDHRAATVRAAIDAARRNDGTA